MGRHHRCHHGDDHSRDQECRSREPPEPDAGLRPRGAAPAADIYNVAAYVRSLSGLEAPPGADIAAGGKVFAANCVTCHGENAKGNRELGAPNLTDPVWAYGSSQEAVVQTITFARNSSMPAWGERLDPTTIKALTLYVHSLGGGE